MIADPWFYALAIPAVLISGISKGGFGGGLGVIAVPMMALIISPIQAAAIMLPILCSMDLLGVWAYRGRWSTPHLKLLVPAALLGIGLGTLTFHILEAAHIRLIIGAIAVWFTLNWAWKYWRKVEVPARPMRVVHDGFWGFVAGFTSFVAHAGGPPIAVALLPQKLDKTLYQATTVVFFISVNYAKLVPYNLLGQFDVENLLTSLALLPLAPVGIWLGIKMHHRVPDGPFYLFCYGFLLLTGLKLSWDGLSYFLT